MQLTSRLSVSLILGVAAVSLAFAFYQTRAQIAGHAAGPQQQALMLGDSLARAAEPLVRSSSYEQLQKLVERFKDRETVAGVAAYNAAGKPLAATTGLVALLGRTPQRGFAGAAQRLGERGIPAAAGCRCMSPPFPCAAAPRSPGRWPSSTTRRISTRRTAALWRRALLGVAVQTVLIVGITLLSVRFSVGRPLRTHDAMAARPAHRESLARRSRPRGDFEPLAREVTQLATSLSAARAAAQEEARLRDTAEADVDDGAAAGFRGRAIGRHAAVCGLQPRTVRASASSAAGSRASCRPAAW